MADYTAKRIEEMETGFAGGFVKARAELGVTVGPEAKRKIYAGPDGLRLLAIGGAPGEPYKIVPLTELGAAS
jgi:hypothetical protein